LKNDENKKLQYAVKFHAKNGLGNKKNDQVRKDLQKYSLWKNNKFTKSLLIWQ